MKGMDVRTLVRVATFGALWGVVEMTLGSALHAAQVPFNGTLLTAIGLGIALVAAAITGKRGTVLGVAAVAGALKLLSFGGGSPLSPMIAILIEGLLAESVLRLFAYRPSRAAFVAAMVAGLLWDVLHPLLVGSLIAGREVAASFARVINQGGNLLGIAPSAVALALVLLILVRVVLGVVAGLAAHSLAEAVRRRAAP